MQSLSTLTTQARRVAGPPAAAAGCCLIRMTVPTAAVTSLRQLAMRVCGDGLEFMRIAICAGGQRIDVWLCVRLSCVAALSHAITRQLPDACFGAAT